MAAIENKDTRYFVEIDLDSLKLTRCSFDQKENLNKGRQKKPNTHRLFITKGQYNKFTQRCRNELLEIMDKKITTQLHRHERY